MRNRFVDETQITVTLLPSPPVNFNSKEGVAMTLQHVLTPYFMDNPQLCALVKLLIIHNLRTNFSPQQLSKDEHYKGKPAYRGRESRVKGGTYLFFCFVNQ